MISQNRYVRIISGVGAGVPASGRKLSMRMVSYNDLLPPGVVAEFTSAEAVGQFFGMVAPNDEEYQRALRYFSFVSKMITAPQVMSFTKWVKANIPLMVVGDTTVKSPARFAQALNNRYPLYLYVYDVNNVSKPVRIATQPIDFTTVTSLADIAAKVQSAIQAAGTQAGNAQLTTATVTVKAALNQFTLNGGVVGSGRIVAIDGPVSNYMGWSTSMSTVVNGQMAQTAAQAIIASIAIDNNFGSFVFPAGLGAPTPSQVQQIAAWNDTQNNMYMFSTATDLSSLSDLYELVKGYSGTALNVKSAYMAEDYIDQAPCEILAATDYDRPGASQNYMYYQFPNRNSVITSDESANLADSLRGNYIGATQSAGRPLSFYQRGILCGGPSAAVDMNIYANEMWLKGTIAQTTMNLFLSTTSVPADLRGEAMILAVLQPIFNQASINGVFSFGKELTPVQQQYISQMTGDPNAWRQVQALGYWVTIRFLSEVNDNTGLTEWKASYVLVYSKGDAIRSVEGSNIMI